jgi:virulence-associated protein VagC
LAESLIIAFFYYKQPDSPYLKIIPKKIIAASYFDQTELSGLLKSIDLLPAVQLAKEDLKNVLNKAKIEFGGEILKIFKDQMALVILPNNGKSLSWMILAQNKEGSEQISIIKERTEKQLKQNYNLTNEDYRQIQITKIQNLEQGPDNLYYASIKNYFILTNNLDSLKGSVDLTIN